MITVAPAGRCWVVCPRFGVTSEVWLYRQVCSLKGFVVEVVCWAHDNRGDFPASGFALRLVDHPIFPTNGTARWWIRAKNLWSGNYYGSVGEEFRVLRRAINEFMPSVILAQFGHTALRILPVARNAKVPVVAHFHGVDITAGLRNSWYVASLRRCIPDLEALVVVAEYQRDILIDLGADDRRVHVIPCGVPINELPVALNVAREPCKFISVGRLVEKKGPLQVVRAFAVCAQRIRSARLTIIGGGPLLPAAQDLARELGVFGQIDFMGPQPPDVVLRHLADASVFVQHSLTSPSGDKEGWPVAIAEAMGIGLPVVATFHAGISSQVREGESGYLVDEGDWQGMADKMHTLAVDPVLRLRLGRMSREIALECFDQAAMVEELERVIAVGSACDAVPIKKGSGGGVRSPSSYRESGDE